MACTVLTQIRINDQLVLKPGNSIKDTNPSLITLQRETLINAMNSIRSYLNDSEQSPVLFLDLGEVYLNIQLEENQIPSKSFISNSISNLFSEKNLNSFLQTDSDYLTDFELQENYIQEFNAVLNAMSNPNSVNTLKTVLKLANDLDSVLEDLKKKAKFLFSKMKENTNKGEKESFVNKIKELNEEIAELNTQLLLVEDDYMKSGIQMEICRKESRVSELRSQNILMISESRQKLYINSILAKKNPVHPRTKSFAEFSKVQLPTTPLSNHPTCDLLPVLQDLEDFLSLAQSLQSALSEFSEISL